MISIHALREEGDAAVLHLLRSMTRFLSTPSARRATPLHQFQYPKQQNFYPRPPRGGRRDLVGNLVRHTKISIHALREEGDVTALFE